VRVGTDSTNRVVAALVVVDDGFWYNTNNSNIGIID